MTQAYCQRRGGVDVVKKSRIIHLWNQSLFIRHNRLNSAIRRRLHLYQINRDLCPTMSRFQRADDNRGKQNSASFIQSVTFGFSISPRAHARANRGAPSAIHTDVSQQIRTTFPKAEHEIDETLPRQTPIQRRLLPPMKNAPRARRRPSRRRFRSHTFSSNSGQSNKARSTRLLQTSFRA